MGCQCTGRRSKSQAVRPEKDCVTTIVRLMASCKDLLEPWIEFLVAKIHGYGEKSTVVQNGAHREPSAGSSLCLSKPCELLLGYGGHSPHENGCGGCTFGVFEDGVSIPGHRCRQKAMCVVVANVFTYSANLPQPFLNSETIPACTSVG